MDQLGHVEPLPGLPGDRQFDVAIVGGGYTGLWTAYYLKSLAPQLAVAVLEAHVCGHGASGRNGGWLMAALDAEVATLGRLAAASRARARAIIHTILPEVRRVLTEESIDCDFSQGGGLFTAARYLEQLGWQRGALQALRGVGYGEEDYSWLDGEELAARLAIRRPLGAIYTPNIARVQPAALVRGLLVACRRRGVHVFEGTRVLACENGRLQTDRGRVSAATRILAVEGFAYEFPDYRRRVLPVQSRIIATEPLDTAAWADLGLAGNEVFEDASPLITYGQRSADNRLVFGARGTYRFGARPQSDFSTDRREFARIHQVMLQCFPQLREVAVTHQWGGTLGIARKIGPHAIYDAVEGLATAGGYSGEGVGASNLMARTLADLVLGRETDLTTMPWSHRAPISRTLRRWEPEPLRWLGYKAITLGQAWEESLCNEAAPAWLRRVARGYNHLVNRMPT
jgi:glycine/D-amino acid oxidase-like deaminating enzyme